MNNKIISAQKMPNTTSTPDKPSQSGPGRLTLAVPPFRQGSKKKKLGNTIPIKRWHELRTHPEALLREVAAFLRPTNREKADTLDRIYLAETSLNTVTRGINIIYNKYLQQNEFPEPEIQRDNLNLALDTIHQISTAYKHVFLQEYESFNSPMKLISDRVRHAGFRIIELAQIEQRLLAATYKTLPNISWKDLNQVFFIIWHFDGLSQPRKLSGALAVKAKNGKVTFSVEQPRSPLQLYLSIQLFGLIDGSSFPNKVQHITDAYLSLLDYKIPIGNYNGEELVDGQLVIAKNQSQPPHFKMQNIEKPAIQLDIFDLWRIVKKDADAQAKINSGVADKISPALATLNETDRTPHINALIKKLRHYTRQDTRKHTITARPLRIFIGFSDSHKAIEEASGHIDDDASMRTGLLHALSENSASIADNNQQIKDERWFLMDESDGGLRVRTQVSRFTTKISVGQIVAFNDISSDTPDLNLGFISRINRLNDVETDISVVKLGEHVKSIIIQDKLRTKKEAAMIGFLIQMNERASQIVLPVSWKIKPQQELSIHTPQGQQKIVVKSPSLQQINFAVYDITASR